LRTTRIQIMKQKQLKIKVTGTLLLLIAVMSYSSCTQDKVLKDITLNLPSTPYDYSFVTSPNGNLNIAERIFGAPQHLDEKATLGRVLFYDTKLSINNSVSCGSCHKQELGFADGAQFSTGFANRKTKRNSLSIANTLDASGLFWDSRAGDANELSLMPVFDHLEMGMESDEMLITKLKNTDYYADLFESAFGSRAVTKENISIALATFVNTMFSNHSKFDLARFGQTELNVEERLGQELFNGKGMCVNCHTLGANFSRGGGYMNHFSPIRGTANIGLDVVYEDEGVGGGSFRIPNLKNVALTGPYMHDGRYATLDEVIEHYNSGIQNTKELDPIFKDGSGNITRLNLTYVEKKALVAFLNTLTDNTFIADPKFSNPFN
jgi:cytochrome c peroxidase